MVGETLDDGLRSGIVIEVSIWAKKYGKISSAREHATLENGNFLVIALLLLCIRRHIRRIPFLKRLVIISRSHYVRVNGGQPIRKHKRGWVACLVTGAT